MIELKNVKKNYPGFELKCSLEVPEGQITGIVGRNGAGKSTIFKAALGLIHVDKGSVMIFGKPVTELKNEDRADIGVVLAGVDFGSLYTIKNLMPVLRAMYKRFDEGEFIRRCKKFGLPMDKKIHEFSTGMKRKLQINIAISHQARLLLLDEPTSGLDVAAREELLDILREYMEREGRAILISSHISTDLESFCDDIYLIDEGEIRLHEETDRLLSEYGVLKVTEEQYKKLDKSYIVLTKKERYGFCCLTNERRFYEENYPGYAIEKGSIDELILLRERGE